MTLSQADLMELYQIVEYCNEFIRHVISQSGADQLHCWYIDYVKDKGVSPHMSRRFRLHIDYLHIRREGYDLIINEKMMSVEDLNLALMALMTFVILEWEGESQHEWYENHTKDNEVPMKSE